MSGMPLISALPLAPAPARADMPSKMETTTRSSDKASFASILGEKQERPELPSLPQTQGPRIDRMAQSTMPTKDQVTSGQMITSDPITPSPQPLNETIPSAAPVGSAQVLENMLFQPLDSGQATEALQSTTEMPLQMSAPDQKTMMMLSSDELSLEAVELPLEHPLRNQGDGVTDTNPAAIAGVAVLAAKPQKMMLTASEILTPVANKVASIVSDSKAESMGRFSPMQGGMAQTSIGLETQDLRTALELRQDNDLKNFTQLIGERTGKDPTEVMDVMIDVMLKRADAEEVQSFEGMLEQAQLVVDGQSGTIRDLQAESEGMEALLSTLLVNDKPSELEESINRKLDRSDAAAARGEAEATTDALPGTTFAALRNISAPSEAVKQASESAVTVRNIAAVSTADAGNSGPKLAKSKSSLSESIQSTAPTGRGSVVLQGLPRSEGFTPDTLLTGAQAAAPSGAPDVRDTQWIESRQNIITSVQTLTRAGGGEMTVELRPLELGQVRINVIQDHGQVHILAQAERPEVIAAVRNDLPMITADLEAKGISISRFDVSSISHSVMDVAWGDGVGKFSSSSQSGFSEDGNGQWESSFYQEQQQFNGRESFNKKREKFYDTMDLVA